MMHAREAEPLLPVSIISNPTYDREASLPVLGSSLQSNQTSSQERTSSSCPECAAGKPVSIEMIVVTTVSTFIDSPFPG